MADPEGEQQSPSPLKSTVFFIPFCIRMIKKKAQIARRRDWRESIKTPRTSRALKRGRKGLRSSRSWCACANIIFCAPPPPQMKILDPPLNVHKVHFSKSVAVLLSFNSHNGSLFRRVATHNIRKGELCIKKWPWDVLSLTHFSLLWRTGSCSRLVISGSMVRSQPSAYTPRQGILSTIVSLNPGVLNGYLAGFFLKMPQR